MNSVIDNQRQYKEHIDDIKEKMLSDEMQKVLKKLRANSRPLDPDIMKALEEGYWDLIGDGETEEL